MHEINRDFHIFIYFAYVKRLYSVKWRNLYGDTAAMPELSLKMCTNSGSSVSDIARARGDQSGFR